MIKGDVKIQLWDTAGEERFRALTPMYYKSAEAILLAFSLIDSETFENLPKWIREIEQNATKTNCVKILVGTKSDMDSLKEV